MATIFIPEFYDFYRTFNAIKTTALNRRPIIKMLFNGVLCKLFSRSLFPRFFYGFRLFGQLMKACEMSRLIGFRLYRKTAVRPFFRSMLFTFPFLLSSFFNLQCTSDFEPAQCLKILFQSGIRQLFYFLKIVAVCAQFICSRSKVDHLILPNSRIVPNNFINFSRS